MKKTIRLTESKVITNPEDIYTVLSKGLFDRAIVVQGNGDKYEVINAGKIRGDGSEWMIYKDKDGSTHTWYYPYYDDIKRGSIKSITVIQESRNTNKKVIRLTESDLHRIVKESVSRILRESEQDNNLASISSPTPLTWGSDRYSKDYDKNRYEASISLFIPSDSKESILIRNNALDILKSMPEVEVYEWYDDGEDWCIDCYVTVSCESIKKVDGILNKLMDKVNLPWDYHYIKGLNASAKDQWWQP